MGQILAGRLHGLVMQRGLKSRKKKKASRIIWMSTNQFHSTSWRMMITTLWRWYICPHLFLSTFHFCFQVKLLNVTTFNVGFYFCHQGPISTSMYLYVNGKWRQNPILKWILPDDLCFRFNIDLIIILQGLHLLGMERNSASV